MERQEFIKIVCGFVGRMAVGRGSAAAAFRNRVRSTKRAAALGLTIPQTFIATVDEVRTQIDRRFP
jgi:hypothetical protein